MSNSAYIRDAQCTPFGFVASDLALLLGAPAVT
jgi:hypothetical protein